MARSSSKDPLDKFRWSVSIDGFQRIGFVSVETPSLIVNTTKYPEGGAHTSPRKLPDSFEYKPITLTRGVMGGTKSRDFRKWVNNLLDITNNTQNSIDSNAVNIANYRRNVVIQHLDRLGRIVQTYVLYNAFPIEYKPASDFSADADDTYSMEKLVLDYESFQVFTPSEGKDKSGTSLDSNVEDLIRNLTRKLF